MTELSDLFSLDPLQHTTETLDELIVKLRGMRGQFSLENNKKAGTVKPKAVKAGALTGAGIKLDLSGVLKK